MAENIFAQLHHKLKSPPYQKNDLEVIDKIQTHQQNEDIRKKDLESLLNDLSDINHTYDSQYPSFFRRIFSGTKNLEGTIGNKLSALNKKMGAIEREAKQSQNVSNTATDSTNKIMPDVNNEKTPIPIFNANDCTLNTFVKRKNLFETYLGTWSNREVLIKKVFLNEETGHQSEKDKKITKDNYLVQYELRDQTNIVQLFGYYQLVPSEIFLVFEYSEYGALYDLIHTLEVSIPLSLQIQMLKDVANAMNYLHTNTPYLHRDLSSESLMIFIIDSKCVIKVTDFVHVRTLTSTVTHSASKVGKELWMAPEILLVQTEDSDTEEDTKGDELTKGEKIYQYSKQSDVWSYSIIMYEVICSKLPFLGDVGELITKLKNQKRPIIEKKIREDNSYKELIELMKRCWLERFDYRPSFNDILINLNTLQNFPDEVLIQDSTTLINNLKDAQANPPIKK